MKAQLSGTAGQVGSLWEEAEGPKLPSLCGVSLRGRAGLGQPVTRAPAQQVCPPALTLGGHGGQEGRGWRQGCCHQTEGHLGKTRTGWEQGWMPWWQSDSRNLGQT